MSQKGVIFFKILISKFFGFLWNLLQFFIEFLGVISLLKIAKRGLFARRTRGADVAQHGTCGEAMQAHADACVARTCRALRTCGRATRVHADTWLTST